MAAECVPEITTMQAYITTHSKFRDRFLHLEEITTWEQFCKHTGTNNDNQVLIRLTDQQAPYGIDWYEVDIKSYENKGVYVPNDQWCLTALKNYVSNQGPKFSFSKDWFNNQINWQDFNSAEFWPDNQPSE
jgi:hypothetical protein